MYNNGLGRIRKKVRRNPRGEKKYLQLFEKELEGLAPDTIRKYLLALYLNKEECEVYEAYNGPGFAVVSPAARRAFDVQRGSSLSGL